MQAKHLILIVNSKALHPEVVNLLDENAQSLAHALHLEAATLLRRRVRENERVSENTVQYYNQFVKQIPGVLRKFLPQNIPVLASVA